MRPCGCPRRREPEVALGAGGDAVRPGSIADAERELGHAPDGSARRWRGGRSTVESGDALAHAAQPSVTRSMCGGPSFDRSTRAWPRTWRNSPVPPVTARTDAASSGTSPDSTMSPLPSSRATTLHWETNGVPNWSTQLMNASPTFAAPLASSRSSRAVMVSPGPGPSLATSVNASSVGLAVEQNRSSRRHPGGPRAPRPFRLLPAEAGYDHRSEDGGEDRRPQAPSAHLVAPFRVGLV